MFDLSSPTVYIPTIFLTIVTAFVAILYKDAKNFTSKNIKNWPYYDEIEASMKYIDRNVLEDGRFQYRRNVDPEIIYSNDFYNSLRHAGVLYSMYMYEKMTGNVEYKKSRIKASRYFVKNYIKKLTDGTYAVITKPEEENIRLKIAKSGASGIALCALANLYTDKKLKLEVLQGLGEFILSMMNEEGNVYAYRDLVTNTINTEAEAIYYPAEAAIGLLYLYEVDDDEKWLNASKKIIDYIIKTRKSLEFQIPFDHWSALAIEKLFKENWVTPEEKNTYRMYVEQMAIPTLTEQITNKNHSYYGAFKDNVRPCSLGTIMEGLASIYNCTDSDSLKQIILKSLSIGCMFLNKVQVKSGEQTGGLPNSANWVKAGVSPNASIIRIDNVQHVMTGWLKFQQISLTTENP